MTDQTIKLYNGEVEIQYRDANHSYWLKKDGDPLSPIKRLTGVTSYLGVLDKPALIPWAVGLTVDFVRDNIEAIKSGSVRPEDVLFLARQAHVKERDIAAETGTAIMAWIEAHIKGEKPDMPEDPKVIKGVNHFLNWVDQTRAEFLWTERIVYSRKYGFVGRADIGIKIDGKEYLGDIKTSNGLYAEVIAQTAAYTKALEEETGVPYAGRWAIRIAKDTEEEYNAKAEEKVRAGKIKGFRPYAPVEAIFLDNDFTALDRDYTGFLSIMGSYTWKKSAEYALKGMRG